MQKYIIFYISIVGLCCSCSSDDKVDSLGAEDFGDLKFWEFCLENYDTDMDGVISLEEAKAVKTMDLSSLYASSLKGIEYFTELTWLVSSNNLVDTLDLSHNPKIKYLNHATHVSSLNELFFAKNTELEEIYTHNASLPNLDLSSCKKLKKAEFGQRSSIQKLDLSNCPEMEELICWGGGRDIHGLNWINNIDLSKCTKLEKLECNYLLELKSLDLSNCVELKSFSIVGTDLDEIDISNNRKLKQFYCFPFASGKQELTVYVWPGFEGIADNDYEEHEGSGYIVNFVVASNNKVF